MSISGKNFNTQNGNYDGSGGIFPERSDDEQANILASFLPDGVVLKAKYLKNKNLFRLLRGFGKTYLRLESKVNELVNGRVLTESTAALDRWENVAGVPDECYKEIGSIDSRQRYTIGKLSSDGVSTAAELKWLCSVFGYDVDVIPGHYFWRNPDARVEFSSEKESRFTIVFQVHTMTSIKSDSVFTFTFPIIFGEDFRGIVQCFIETVIDANVNGLWINADDLGGVVKDKIGEADVYKDLIGAPDTYKDDIDVE